jgi:zinc transport system substrate-binding protein
MQTDIKKGYTLGQVMSLVAAALIITSLIWIVVNRQVTPAPVVNDSLRVVASFYPVYFFAQEIGGERAVVKNLTPAGAEPHDYEPTPQDIVAIESSQLLILNGNGLEPWSENIKNNLANSSAVIVTAGEGLATEIVEEDGAEIKDPHIWLSPLLASVMVDKIAAGYIAADQVGADYYQANARTLKQKLLDLDANYRQGLSQCKTNDIITTHAAFGYVAKAYGLDQVAISGLSPEAEPTPKALSDVVQFAREHQVKYIFFEELVSPKLAETIAQEVGATTLILSPLEGLAAEDLAEGHDYFSIMQKNLDNLKLALQCTI